MKRHMVVGVECAPIGHSIEDSLGLVPARPRRPLLARAVSSDVSESDTAAEMSNASLSPLPLPSEESLSCASAARSAAPAAPTRPAGAAACAGGKEEEIGLRSMRCLGRWSVLWGRSWWPARSLVGGSSNAAAASPQNGFSPATGMPTGASVSSLPGHLRVTSLLKTRFSQQKPSRNICAVKERKRPLC